jgi:ATP-dependent exoDNAse (exonuclease V) alpha subunit
VTTASFGRPTTSKQAAQPDRARDRGDLGFIARIDPERGEVVIDFDGREVAYEVGELDELVPASETTVHKAQGAEDPAVVVPLEQISHQLAGAA